MRSMLRSMRALLKTSERKLDEAKKTIDKLREKVNKILATLQVLKGLVEEVQKKEQALKGQKTAEGVTAILEGVANDVTNGIEKADGTTATTVRNVFSGIGKFVVSLVKILKRPDVTGMLSTALEKIENAIDIIKKQKNNMEKELALIIIWRDAVDEVKQNVFAGDLDGDEQDLVDEIEDIISDDRDVNEIYDAFGELKIAASAYLRQVKKSCPVCAA